MPAKIDVGSTFDDKYKIESELGAGANGTVYLATEELLGRNVAIKVLRPGAAAVSRARFEREAKALNLLTHPNIIHVFRYGYFSDDMPFIVMELAEGVSLRQLIEEEQCLRCDRAIDIAMQIASALEYAHQKQIIHRDLKPENIMVREVDGRANVKVLDFGLCKQESSSNQQASLTETGLILGTVLYMSPEQCLGKDPDWRSDIYSFGCILYEMITGSPPFNSDNAATVVLKHVSDPMPEILSLSPGSGLPEELEQVILKCTAKKKEERYQDFAEIKSALATIRGLNSLARFNIAEANSAPALRMLKRIPKRAILGLGIFTVLILAAGTTYLATSNAGNAFLASQIQATFTANDSIKYLRQLLAYALDSKRPKAAEEIVERTTNSKLFSTWPVIDREELLNAYKEEYGRVGMAAESFALRLRYFGLALESVQRGTKDQAKQLEVATAMAKDMLSENFSKRQWREIFVVLENKTSLLGSHRKPKFCYLSALLTESMLHQESGYGTDNLQQLAEECYFAATCAYLANQDQMAKRYAEEALRIAKKTDAVAVIHRTHVTLGMMALKEGRLADGLKERDLALESGKGLLLSSANTNRLDCLLAACKLGKYIPYESFSGTAKISPRAPNPFFEFYNK